MADALVIRAAIRMGAEVVPLGQCPVVSYMPPYPYYKNVPYILF
jgi:hypothetical protein